MRRRKPLRARTPLQRRKALKATKGLSPGKLERRTPMRRTGMRRARPRVPLFDDRQMRQAWIRGVFAKAPKDAKGRVVCPVCGQPPGGKRGRLTGHHIVEQRYLRRYVRSLRLPAYEASVLLARLRWDVRNGLPVCEWDHELHSTAKQRIPFRLLDAKAHQFAREVLADYTLDRYYDRAT